MYVQLYVSKSFSRDKSRGEGYCSLSAPWVKLQMLLTSLRIIFFDISATVNGRASVVYNLNLSLENNIITTIKCI